MSIRRWKDIEPVLNTLLKNEVPSGGIPRRYESAMLRQWWNNAQIRLSTMRPLHRHLVYDENDGISVDLPDGFYRPRLVILPDKRQLPRLHIEEKFYNPNAVGYAIYEDKLMILGIKPKHWLLAYDAYYPMVTGDDSRIEVPLWADEACAVYVAMEAVTKELIADAQYRKFLSKVQDSGNPQQSPFLPVAKWLEERFNAIVATHSDDDKDAFA